jgi:hypothetical protein
MKDEVRDQLEPGVRRQDVEQHKQQQPAIAPARCRFVPVRRHISCRRGHALLTPNILFSQFPAALMQSCAAQAGQLQEPKNLSTNFPA